MPDSKLIGIAEAVKDLLDAASLSMAFTPTREHVTDVELPDLSDLAVTVIPRARELDVAGRAMSKQDLLIDVAIRKKLAAVDTEQAQIDALDYFTEEVVELLAFTRLTDPDAEWVGSENVPAYDAEHLRKFRQYTSIVTLRFRVIEVAS